MEEIETKIIQTEERNHLFYCDNCKEKIGEFIEYDDGYYEEIGKYEETYKSRNVGSYQLELHLCDKCKIVYNNKIIEAITKIGFKKV